MAVSREPTLSVHWAAIATAAVILLRVGCLGVPGLTDNTESRYASIAWEMWRTGDWVTPRVFIKGALVPFWGKPPLEFWLTTLSYKLFGVGEASARVPSVLLGVATVVATVYLARRFWGRRVAAVSGLMLSSSVLFFVLSGACVLDVPLSAAVTGAMTAFALHTHTGAKSWGLAFFLSLALGALAKGPVTLVLVGIAIGLWLAATRRWKSLAALPWVPGILLFAVVAVPWYVLAERSTPGFLRYFIVHEHFLRYVSHSYGDLYGSGRVQPYGASWVMLAGSFLPWTVVAAVALTKCFRAGRLLAVVREEPWLIYALLWGLTPALFFTLARQMLSTYLLPGLPGLAVAAGVGVVRWGESEGAAGLLRLLRWHVVAVAALLGALAVVSATQGGLYVVTGGAVACVAVGVVVVGELSVRRREVLGAMAVVGFGAAVLYFGAVTTFAARIDEQFSAKTVLRQALANPGNRGRPVLMPYGDEYSAIFYSQAVYGAQMEHQGNGGEPLVRERLSSCGRELFLFKRKQWNRLTEETRSQLAPAAETPRWVAAVATQ